MRNVRLWRALLGVDQRTVIEDIEVEEDDADGETLVVARCALAVGCRVDVAAVGAGRPGMTAVRARAGGVAWIGARCRWCWRPRRRG